MPRNPTKPRRFKGAATDWREFYCRLGHAPADSVEFYFWGVGELREWWYANGPGLLSRWQPSEPTAIWAVRRWGLPGNPPRNRRHLDEAGPLYQDLR